MMFSRKFWSHVAQKAQGAATIVHNCIGPQGFYAGPGERYMHQYWTRDFGLALMPAVASSTTIFGNQLFLGDGEAAIHRHLSNLAERQGRDGAIPILYADFPQLLAKKIQQKGHFDPTARTLSIGDSFVLGRIFDGMFGDSRQFPEFADFERVRFRTERGLYRLTPGTKDSELLFAFAVATHSGLRLSEPIIQAAARALTYLESRHVHIEEGLMVGADWRDTMDKFFSDRFLLSNNAIRYQVHKLLGTGAEEAIRQKIDETFWNGWTYIDYPGADRFDPLGASLAVLYDLVPPERYPAVMQGFRSVDTKHGVTIKCRHNAYAPREVEVIERTDGVVVWPFVCGFAALAAFKMGGTRFALEQLAKMANQKGFGEWYDPSTGQQYGEPLQGWSAALFLRVCEAAVNNGCVELSQLRTQ